MGAVRDESRGPGLGGYAIKSTKRSPALTSSGWVRLTVKRTFLLRAPGADSLAIACNLVRPGRVGHEVALPGEATMTRRMKIWLTVATLFTLVNVAGGWMAARTDEMMHAGVHVLLVLVGALWMSRIMARSKASPEAVANALPQDGPLEQLQQSVDAIALEVERIGEAQRYTAKLMADRAAQPKSDR